MAATIQTAPPTAPPEAPGRAGQLRALAADIKLAHSVFALPFALLAAFMAASPAGGTIDWRRFGAQLLLVVVAMVLARTVAMLANRLLDRRLDASNPRTAGRALPAGRASSRTAIGAALAAAALFVGVCGMFLLLDGNPWPLLLAVPVLLWISAYGLFKRFTAWCHLYLGSSLAISPLAAVIAVDPAQLAQPSIWLLSLLVLCWVAGFDVIYALQDVEVDRRDRLFSLPSRLGVPGAMWVSRGLHVVAAAALWGIALGDPRAGAALLVAAVLVTVLLLLEHLTVARWGTTRIALTFFTLNGLISLVIGLAGIVDVLAH